ncbi:sigma 54-interacting transcriptional regulator [Pseudomonas sp. HT11]|uniref:sigma 54-interacting transcriptional regulator n=1 Tax=Pseudomonas sp. HT11 TaxID=3230490 RepID=UPI00385008AC
MPQGEKDLRSIRAKALVFSEPRSLQLLDYLKRVGPSEAPVLINGETGTGKSTTACSRGAHGLEQQRLE